MGQGNLYTQIDGLRSFAQTHADVSADMSRAIGSGVYAADVASTHGPIAAGVHDALSGALDTRMFAQQSTLDVSRNLADSLRLAARGYEGVDDDTAQRLRSAADTVDGAEAASAGHLGGLGGGMEDIAGTLTSAGKDAAGALGGVIGPMTSGLGSAASSLGSGLSSAAGAAANSITQAVSQAAKAVPSAASAAVPASAIAEQTHPADNDGAAPVSGDGGQAGPGAGAAPGAPPGEHVTLARSASGQEGGGLVV